MEKTAPQIKFDSKFLNRVFALIFVVLTLVFFYYMGSTPDRRYIYITEFTGDSVSVVDTATNNIVNTIKLEK